MTEAERNLLLVKGAISELPAYDREKVRQIAYQIRGTIAEYPAAGAMALALVGAEAAAKAD